MGEMCSSVVIAASSKAGRIHSWRIAKNLTLQVRQALKLLLGANNRLNTAYVLKESFGHLSDCQREVWARRFFDQWRAALKWQRLKPYEEFARPSDYAIQNISGSRY